MGKVILNSLLWLMGFALLFLYHWMYPFDSLMASNMLTASVDIASLFGCMLVINRYLVPKLLYKKRPALFILGLLLLFVISSFFIQLVERQWYKHTGSLSPEAEKVFYSFSYEVFNTYIPQLVGCVCICAFRLLNDHWVSQNRYEALQRENAQTELNFLKAQINPHFLFNSINSLYAEIDKTNPTARDIVLRFSEMLRYQLYECNVEKIAMEREIDYLRNYVSLEKLRKEDYLDVRFDIKGHMNGLEIAPLLFITFIENAFKYASNHEDKENSIYIQLEKQDAYILFECRNTRDSVTSRNLVEDRGIGINNVKRRLELLYPGKHQLAIEDSEHRFNVSLKIKTG